MDSENQAPRELCRGVDRPTESSAPRSREHDQPSYLIDCRLIDWGSRRPPDRPIILAEFNGDGGDVVALASACLARHAAAFIAQPCGPKGGGWRRAFRFFGQPAGWPGICSCRRRAYRQSSSGSSACQRIATTTVSSSSDREVGFGSLGPVGKSAVALRFFHLATVF